jgi:hypothetical protein
MEIYQATCLQSWLGQEIRNVLYYEYSGSAPSSAILQGMADDIRGAWSTGHNTYLKNTWRLYGVDWRRVDAPGWPTVGFGFTSGDLVGALSSGEDIPTQIALLVTGTAYAPPPNKVRTYLAGFTEAGLNNGLFATSVRNAAVTWASAIDTLADSGETMTRVAVKWDRVNDVVTDYNAVGNYFTSQVPATQRRRRIGRGM